MIAPLTCFHRNPEMTSHCSITFIYCGFWGSGSGRLILLSSSYKYYLSLRVRALISVCVCVYSYITRVTGTHTTSKRKGPWFLFLQPSKSHSHGWTDASVVFHWSRAVWLCPWGLSAQPVGTYSCCSESEWLYCPFYHIQHEQWNETMFLQYHGAT